jgi:hypothetical protein
MVVARHRAYVMGLTVIITFSAAVGVYALERGAPATTDLSLTGVRSGGLR